MLVLLILAPSLFLLALHGIFLVGRGRKVSLILYVSGSFVLIVAFVLAAVWLLKHPSWIEHLMTSLWNETRIFGRTQIQDAVRGILKIDNKYNTY
jgi:hypothetical protein